MIVELSKSEMHVALQVAKFRNQISIKKNRQPFNGVSAKSEEDELQPHLIGVPSEMAVAKALNRYWAPEFVDLLEYDIQPDVQVRATKHQFGKLIIHKKDCDAHKFFLVVANENKFRIAGWLYGRDAKQEKFWSDPTGKNRWAFFVPQTELEERS